MGGIACAPFAQGDVVVVWKLDRLGCNLAHLVGTVEDLSDCGVGLRVLAGQGVQIDTTTGRRPSGIRRLRCLGGAERQLIREGMVARLEAARARGCTGRMAGEAHRQNPLTITV